MSKLNEKIFKFLIKNERSKRLHSLLSRFSNNGFIEEEAKEEDWMFGTADRQVLREDGQWLKFLPEDEIQHTGGTDTMACVSFSLNNCVEILSKQRYNIIRNDSDRFLAKVSNTSPRGNSQRNVIDARRHNGIVEEALWPMETGMSWSAYYSPINPFIIEQAKEDLKHYDINYEFVFSTNPQSLMNALKFSPLWIAGYSWFRQGNLYRSVGNPNHAFVLVGYVEGSHWIAYDSYSPHVKFLAWDYQFHFPKTVYLEAKDTKRQERETLLSKGIKYVMRTDTVNGGRGQIYEIKPEGLVELSQIDKMKSDEIQDFMNNWVREHISKKILTGVTEKHYDNLI